VDDARKLADQLRLLGFETTLVVEPQTAEALTAVERFESELHPTTNGTALLAFFGHCAQLGDQNFLVFERACERVRADLP
jgi:uncharacterized caspase-like protein